MLELSESRYCARLADTDADVRAAQHLRYVSFGKGDDPVGLDNDPFDEICKHILVEEVGTGRLVCCFRFLTMTNGAGVARSYSAQFYELSALASFRGPMVEMGRFCIHPRAHDADILRVAWGAVTRFVDENGIEMLFGCSSFKGTDAKAYIDAFSILNERHIGPRCWLPEVKAPKVFRFAHNSGQRRPDIRLAMRRMPPLLRTYLMMGGWVSDHAVVDSMMNTLHVFTGVEVSAIPPARKRFLRAAAQ